MFSAIYLINVIAKKSNEMSRYKAVARLLLQKKKKSFSTSLLHFHETTYPIRIFNTQSILAKCLSQMLGVVSRLVGNTPTQSTLPKSTSRPLQHGIARQRPTCRQGKSITKPSPIPQSKWRITVPLTTIQLGHVPGLS
jgi:predicted amidophosphoribosyltransferase